MWGRWHQIEERFTAAVVGVVIVGVVREMRVNVVHSQVLSQVHQGGGFESQLVSVIGGHFFCLGAHQVDVPNHSIQILIRTVVSVVGGVGGRLNSVLEAIILCVARVLESLLVILFGGINASVLLV